MKTRFVLIAAAVLAAPAVALAQWSDNFDSYPTGVSMNGLGGWAGWDNTPAAAGATSDAFALSAPNSIVIEGGADAVHTYDATSGVWTFTAHQFIPRDFTGTSYFILLNQYNHGGPYNWSVQIQFQGTTGLVVDDNHASNPISYVRGEWAELRFEIDLDNDTVSEYYNGQLLASGTWTSGPNSLLAIGAVDLFANGASPVYYDNMSLIPGPASLALLGLGALAAGRRRR